MSELGVQPGKSGTIRITATFTDSAGEAVAPKTLTRSLYGHNMTIIYEDVAVMQTLASVMSWTITGDDNSPDYGLERLFVLRGTYDSLTDGDDCSLGDQCAEYSLKECSV